MIDDENFDFGSSLNNPSCCLRLTFSLCLHFLVLDADYWLIWWQVASCRQQIVIS
jgi:hypothetical protein